jgi:hypothetical protein
MEKKNRFVKIAEQQANEDAHPTQFIFCSALQYYH